MNGMFLLEYDDALIRDMSDIEIAFCTIKSSLGMSLC